MSKIVRRSHFDRFLRFRNNHLQLRVRPGVFWNDCVSTNIVIDVFSAHRSKSGRIGIFRLLSLSRSSHSQLCQNGGYILRADLLDHREFFGLSSSKENTGILDRWRIFRKMATRNLTDIYINLRTEITRFKAYSLGDSVRSDSPGVLYFHTNCATNYRLNSQ